MERKRVLRYCVRAACVCVRVRVNGDSFGFIPGNIPKTDQTIA